MYGVADIQVFGIVTVFSCQWVELVNVVNYFANLLAWFSSWIF